MELLKEAWQELIRELAFIIGHMDKWWVGLDRMEQVFILSVTCAGFLILGTVRPVPRPADRTRGYDRGDGSDMLKQLCFAIAVLLMFAFVTDTVVKTVV
ncbi:MAG: hypothetical protein AAFQ84_00825 [Pseudomonadota bacterium]